MSKRTFVDSLGDDLRRAYRKHMAARSIRAKSLVALGFAALVMAGTVFGVLTLSKPTPNAKSDVSAEGSSGLGSRSMLATRPSLKIAGPTGLVGPTGSVSPSGGPGSPNVSPDDPVTCETPCNQGALGTAANQAQSIAGRQYFTGVTVDPTAKKVDVYLTRAPQSVIDAIDAKHPGLYVFHSAQHTWAEVTQLLNSIATMDLKAHGIDLFELSPTQDGHVVVGVEKKGLADARTVLADRFGSDMIRLYGVTPADIPAAPAEDLAAK